MPLLQRQIWFLRVLGTLGVFLMVEGTWVFRLTREPHDLVCGAVLLLLVLVARWRWAAAADERSTT